MPKIVVEFLILSLIIHELLPVIGVRLHKLFDIVENGALGFQYVIRLGPTDVPDLLVTCIGRGNDPNPVVVPPILTQPYEVGASDSFPTAPFRGENCEAVQPEEVGISFDREGALLGRVDPEPPAITALNDAPVTTTPAASTTPLLLYFISKVGR
eukprot:scaffold36004_cov112-Isochrysis_galbana.AAC.1